MSQNPFLLSDGIDTHPDALRGEALRDRAWRVVEPQYLARLAGLVEEFGRAKSKGLGSDDPAPVAESAVAGRVATLLIEAERHVAGRIDPASGRIEYGDLAHPEIDDVLAISASWFLIKGAKSSSSQPSACRRKLELPASIAFRVTKMLCAKGINHRRTSQLSSGAEMVYRGDPL